MKTCPTCGNNYDDDLSYCLQDGTRLAAQPTVDLTNHPTEVLPQNTDLNNAETIVSASNAAKPQPKTFRMSAVEPSTRMGCALTIGQVAAGLIVVVGLGVVGIFFALRTTNDVAQLEPIQANRSNPVTSSTPIDSSANGGSFSMNTANASPVATSSTPNKTASNSAANSHITTANVAPTNTPMPLPTRVKPIPGGVLNGRAVSLPQPPFPPAARIRAVQTVRVKVLLDENGRVVTASAVNGYPLFRSAAEQAARAARFSPTLLGGQPVKVVGVIVYNFVP